MDHELSYNFTKKEPFIPVLSMADRFMAQMEELKKEGKTVEFVSLRKWQAERAGIKTMLPKDQSRPQAQAI